MSNPEQAVRDAANALHAAIVDGQKAGLDITWPRHFGELPNIIIGATGNYGVSVHTTAPAGTSPETLAKANDAALAAAADVIERAPDRAYSDAELEAMTKTELQKLASDRHVDISAATTKAEIVAAIKAAQTG